MRQIGLDIRPHPAADARGDAHQLPFADDSFDAVVSMEVLEHLHSPERVVDEIRRVLKPEGRLVLTTRFIFHIHGAPVDYYRYTRHGLEYLFRDFADLRVQSQHSGYMSFLVTLGRLIAEEAAIFRILALPLGVLVNLLAPLDPLMRRVLPIEGLTTGYFVSCRK
jgi:SAM-dependent methyltransferase